MFEIIENSYTWWVFFVYFFGECEIKFIYIYIYIPLRFYNTMQYIQYDTLI